MSCRYIKYTLGQESVHDGPIQLSKTGMHFCKELESVFNYYSNGIFCAVEIPLDAQVITDGNQSVTNKLTPISLLDGEYKSLGNTYYFKSGKLHCGGDQSIPAVIDRYGVKLWYKDGKLHRDGDLPSVISAEGDKHWCKNGQFHREGDLPAIINTNGTKHWYKDGKLHRDGDQPAQIFADGNKAWYKEGVLHRDGDLPQRIYPNGAQYFYKQGGGITVIVPSMPPRRCNNTCIIS